MLWHSNHKTKEYFRIQKLFYHTINYGNCFLLKLRTIFENQVVYKKSNFEDDKVYADTLLIAYLFPKLEFSK
jgi:hypothetical protein